MIWAMKSSDSGGEGGEEDSGGGGESTKAVEWRRRGHQFSTTSMSTSSGWMITTMFVFFFISSTAAVLSNSTFKGEQQSDINARIGQSAFLPCELEPNNVTTGFEITTQCGIVHSVKWYRGANRIFLYSGGPRTTQPHREGYTDRYDRSYWSTEPNSTLGFLVMDNITALDEGVYKCEITYTKVHEGCNIVQFINLTTYTDPESISVGTLVEPNDFSAHNYIDPTSDFYDGKNSDPKFGLMKKLTSGAIVGPVDEGNKIRLVCRAGRARPVPQVTWWQHSRGPIYDSDLVDYQYRKVDSDLSDDVFSYSGLWVAQSVLTVVGKRGANGRYECRVKTVTDSSPILTSNVEVTVNVSPYSVEMSTSSSGTTVTTASKVDDRNKSQNDRNSGDVIYAETTEGQPLVIRCAARGARPQANVTWYYYYKDQENDDDNDYGSGIRNEQNIHAPTVQSSKHGAPVMLGNSQQSGGSTARSPSDYFISEQRRMEGGAEIIGPVEIAQHTEYQADGTRDTHSQLSMSQLHRQQDGSILRCDAFNNVGSSPNQPLTVNMTIRVKYVPTAWVVPITDGENSGAIVEDEIRNDIGQQRKGGIDNGNNINPITIDASKDTYDGSHYQTILYTVVVNETKELRLNCAYHANPDKLRTPVKWYRDGIELQLVDEEEPSSSNHGSSYAAVTPATGTGTLSGSSNGAINRFRMNPMGNVAKYARVKGLANGNGGIHGDGNGEDATVLVVRKLTRSDSGRYECRVRNSVGAANSTNFANVRVQYTPKVKLHVILDDSLDENQTSSTTSSSINNNMVGSNPIVLESEHRNVTLRCAVQLEEDQKNIEDTNSDPSLNLTSVHWYWNGVQMQLPNCTRPTDSSDIFGDEEDGDNDFDIENNDSENNAMNFNYETSEPHGEGEYDSYAVDNDTRRRNKKQRKVVCTDRELILVNVTKNIHGNYSCRARNAAGLLTPMSDQTPLIVYFAPGPVTLEFSPRRVIKGRNVTLRCNAQYLGRPQHPTRYSWFRDGHPFYHQNQGLNPSINSGTGISIGLNGNNGGGNFNPEWFVDHVSLETRANFTCSAYNEGGVTYSEPVYIEVFAPPNYITGPPQYLGVAYNATHVNASCTVECYPHCSVNWLRRGTLIDPINNLMDKERYSILTEYLPAERLKNDFEAVRSILIWRMDNWPGGRGLDPITDSTEYSCRSSGNEVGPPVSESIMNFSVEYPPGNMTVSKTIVQVSEGNIPEKVFCRAEGRPQPTFEWRYIPNTNNWNVPGNSSQSIQPSSQQRLSSIANAGNSGVSGGSGSGGSQINNQQLVLNSAVGRHQAGYYACVARNTHGNETAYTYLDVMYKPRCQLKMITVDQFKQESSASLTDQSSELEEFLSSSSGEKRILVCTATAHPGHVQYTWTIRNSGRQNDTSTSLTSDSPATERVITVSVGSPSNSRTNEMDSMGSYNRSILILQDRLEVSNNDDDEGRGSDNIPSNGASEGVRTYVCTVNNTVGMDQCSIQVQGDAPWWKQLLATIGLGGLPVMVVLVALVVILLLIVIIVIVILLLFVCKNRYIKPSNGVPGGRQKYSRGGAGQQQDNESNLGATGDSKAAFYENLPFHGMRPPPNQPSAIQSSNGNGNAVGRANYKPPPPPAADASPSPSLIHRSPNGGYVSLLRRSAVPESNAAVAGRPTAAVRFNSLQRPNRGSATAWQRRDRQFRSMRTVAIGGGDDKSVAERSAIGRPTVGVDRRLTGRQDDDNNDSGGGGGGEAKASTAATSDRGGDGRKDAFSASTFPKPAPRTRVPSASVAPPPPPSLSRRDTYENLQQLLNGAGEGSAIGSDKLTGVGIGARSLDEFYRMQIQQQRQPLYRVDGDDAPATALASGYSTVGGGVVHHRQQQQQQQQQSIEMTQFEMTAGPGREDVYQKSQKHQQQNAIGRYNNDGDGIGGDVDKVCKTMFAGGGTMGRRRRADQQALDGGVGQSTDRYYGGGSSQHLQQQYHHHHHHHHHQQQQQYGNNRRRGNADGPLVQPTPGISSYNTVSGVGYYAADVYASMGARQQQSKRQQQQQRPYGGGAADEQTLAAARSWRRQQNRRRRAGVGGGVVAVEPDDDADQPQPAAASDYAADAEADDPPSPQPPADRYRGAGAAVAELDVVHRHRQRQKGDARNCSAAQPAAAEPQRANGGGTDKNAVKFHDVGREIDV